MTTPQPEGPRRVHHDICSAVQALAMGVAVCFGPSTWTRSGSACGTRIAFAHPLDGGRAALAHARCRRRWPGCPAPDSTLPGGSCSDRSPPTTSSCGRRCSATCTSCPATGDALAQFPACRRAPVGRWPVPRSPPGEPRCSPGRARALIRRLDAPLTSAFALALVVAARGRLAGRRGAGRGCWPARWSASWSSSAAPWGGTDPARSTRCHRADSTLLDVTPRQLRAMARCPRYARALAQRTGTAPGSARSTSSCNRPGA
ncbi:hypothetical protein HBB16_14395, partial [Pseudonocardia sp. MCCB 268]|nr:hypothetical protein [Pseudonocardia cytotoxica]